MRRGVKYLFEELWTEDGVGREVSVGEESGRFPEKVAKKVVWGVGLLSGEGGGRLLKVSEVWVDDWEEVDEEEEEVGKGVLGGSEGDEEGDWGEEDWEEEGLGRWDWEKDGEVVLGCCCCWVGGEDCCWVVVDWVVDWEEIEDWVAASAWKEIDIFF
jgi:hypothetical protein